MKLSYLDELDHLPRIGARGEAEREYGRSSTPSEVLEDDIRGGEAMHPAIVSLAMRGYSRERLEALLHESAAKTARPDRWQQCLQRDLPRALASAEGKRARKIAEKLATAPPPPRPVETDLPVIGADGFAKMTVKPRRWIVPALIPANEPTLIYGPGATGKSLLLLQLALSVAAWQPWLGRAVPRGRVLFMTCEDDVEEIHRRAEAILRAYGCTWESMDDRLCIVPMRRTELSAVLASPTRDGTLTVTSTYQAMKRLVDRFKPDLAIVDTLADVFAGNENDRGHAKQFVKLLDSAFGCTFIVSAHPSVSGETTGRGMSGSTGWQGAVRSHLYFERVRGEDGVETDPDLRQLSNMKGNYGRKGEGDFELRWEAGVFVETDKRVREAVDTDTADAVFLELLRVYNARKVHVSTSRGSNNAATVFAREELAKSKRITKRMLEAAMGRLLDSGRVVNVAHRVGSDPRYHLEIAPE